MGDRSETAFLKLYERLPEADLCRSDHYSSGHYSVYQWLPANRCQAGKDGAVNRNEGLHSRLRDKLNRLHRRTKGYREPRATARAWPCSVIPSRWSA